jgi:hypothetical protein
MCKTTPEQKFVKEAVETANLIGLKSVEIATKSLKQASIRKKYHP